MFRLSKEVLVLIFRNLTISDQCTMNKVCSYTKSIIEDLVWPRQYTTFVSGSFNAKRLELEEFVEFFAIMQSRIRTLVLSETTHIAFRSFRSEMAFYLSFDFPLMRRFEWDDERFTMSDMTVVHERWPALEYLRLSNSIVYGDHIKDSRDCWDALKRCGTIHKLNLYNMSRFDKILEYIEKTPRLVHIYLSSQIGFRREILLELVEPLIELLKSQPDRGPFLITSAYIPADLLLLEAYVEQDVLRCVSEIRKEKRPKPPYIEYRFKPLEIPEEESEQTDLEDITECTENSTENSEKNLVTEG